MRRALTAVTAGAGGLAGLLVLGGGWVYSSQLLPATARDRTFDMRATVNPDGTVTLPAERRACAQSFGLLLQGGVYLRYGGRLEGTCVDDPLPGQTVRREVVEVVEGTPVIGVQVDARFDEYVFTSDPLDAGIAAEEVLVDTEHGPAAAWFVPGTRADWVVFVHGRTATRAEALRLMGPVIDAGYPSLAITYRNDLAGGPAAPRDHGLFGAHEWPDLASAVGHAHEAGAQRIVLVGYSQGASLVAFYLRNAGTRGIAGVVLDSPLLSLPQTLVQQARRRKIPDLLIAPILWGTHLFADLRGGLQIEAVDHVDALAAMEVPMLLIHGDADDFVPVDPSDALAAASGDNLTYLRIPGAGHVEGWNTDRDTYVTAVLSFLRGL